MTFYFHKITTQIWRWRRFLVVLAAAGLVWTGTNLVLPRITTRQIVTARHELHPGQLLREADLELRPIPTALLGSEHYNQVKALVGRQVALNIPSQTVLIPAMLQGKGQLPRGGNQHQAIVSVNVPESDLRLVSPGTHIVFYLPRSSPSPVRPESDSKTSSGPTAGSAGEKSIHSGAPLVNKNTGNDTSNENKKPAELITPVPDALLVDLPPNTEAIPALVLSVVNESGGLVGSSKKDLQVAVAQKDAAKLLQPLKNEALRLAAY